jgi:hypothetical protein
MDNKMHLRGSQHHGGPAHYSKHSFNQSQNTAIGGQLPQYSADSQLASSQGVHFKLTSNHPQTTSLISSAFSCTEQTNQGQHPYQHFGRETEMPYNLTE